MSDPFDRHVAEEVARRTARRLDILRRERPDLLAERLESLGPEVLNELLELTRLPSALANREPPRRRVGIQGMDYCTNRLVVGRARRGLREIDLPGEEDLATLDDEDLMAARRIVPETLPGNVLG
jgi:hypothetical protein